MKNKFYFELHRMIVFYNCVFDWLFGRSFHKCRDWMWYNMDVYIRSVSSVVLSFFSEHFIHFRDENFFIPNQTNI